jgi:IclR family transcriptional regulator, acetate operon repressor
VESTRVLRTGSRLGMLLPARTDSGGKALLAELPTEALAIPYPRGRADTRRLQPAGPGSA